MSGLFTIYRRELAGLFLAPLAWVLVCLTLLYNGLFFVHYLGESGGQVDVALELTLGGGLPFWFLVAFLPPLLTMRMISEESRSGMLEFLQTAPVTDRAVVGGKALAATSFLGLIWASVAVYGLALHLLGAPPDWGQLSTGLFGALLVGALFSAMGLTCSALSGTPLLAAFLATVLNFGVLFLPIAGGGLREASPDLHAWLTARVNVIANYQASFLTGALDTAHVTFFVAWTGVFLFATVRLVESKRWFG